MVLLGRKVTYVTEQEDTMTDRERLQRLAHVARRYYEDGARQSDIARELGVSRPLISRMLHEAKALGIVEITIHTPEEKDAALMGRLSRAAGLTGVRIVEDGEDASITNRRLAEETFSFLLEEKADRVGIGWGHFIGEMVEVIEKEGPRKSAVSLVMPLVGNAGIPIRNYHSNENVRVLAEGLGAAPYFLYLPALAESMEEKKLFCSTELYRQMEAEWLRMDTALVNIGNYPSTPDFASVARYGNRLQKYRAQGRFLAYFCNEEGTVITSDEDFAIQIPLPLLKRCRRIIGLCSANTSVHALRSALKTGLFTHLLCSRSLAAEYVKAFHI